MIKAHIIDLMQILSGNDYKILILFKLNCKLHVILVLLLHELHSRHQQKFGHASRGLHKYDQK